MATPSPSGDKNQDGFDFAGLLFNDNKADSRKKRPVKIAPKSMEEKVHTKPNKLSNPGDKQTITRQTDASPCNKAINSNMKTATITSAQVEAIGTCNSVDLDKSDKPTQSTQSEEMKLFRNEMLELHKNSFNEMKTFLTSLQQPSSSRTSISTSGLKRSHDHDISEDSGDEWPMSKHSRIMPTERDVIDEIDDLLDDQQSLPSARHVQESDNTGAVNVNNDEMEDDIFIEDLLVQEYSVVENVGQEVNAKMAGIVNQLMINSPEEKILKIMDKYPRPANIEAKVSRVNKEIWGNLKSGTRSNDIKYKRMADRMVKCLYSMTNLADTLLSLNKHSIDLKRQTTGTNKVEVQNISQKVADCTKMAMDSLVLIGHANQELNQRRREALKPDLNTRFKQICNPGANTGSSEYLFGDDLSKTVKDLKETSQVGSSFAGHSNPYNSNNRNYQPNYSRRGYSNKNSGHFLGFRRQGNFSSHRKGNSSKFRKKEKDSYKKQA